MEAAPQGWRLSRIVESILMPLRFGWLGAVILYSAASQAAQPVRERSAMVVTREKHATETGVEVLRAGGNAVDAAVAVGFALAVTHPSAGNLGGGGFLLVLLADGTTNFIDFRERAPFTASRDMYLGTDGNQTQDSRIGYRAAGVPGTVRGLELAWKRYGRRKWAELVAPAVRLAAKGFPVSWGLAQSLRGHESLFNRFPESRRVFLREGRFYEKDDIFVQPELARTLERIQAQGSAGFYEGETARLLAADMAANGGLITARDLKEYAAVERRPLTGTYRGHTIITAPPPSSGGVGILQMMGMLEGSGYEKSGAGSAATLHYLAECMRRFFADRSRHFGDPDFVRLPLRTLLSPDYIRARRQSIDPQRVTPSAELGPGEAPSESAETTHYSIVDREGNVAAVTYTLNGGFGSGVTAKGLGFLLNNEMDDFAAKPGEPNLFGLVQGEANAVAPAKRPLSSMTPTIVLKDGRFFMAVGSPGGPTIINTVLQVILNVIDFGMNMQEATDWPRIHHQWMPDEIRTEHTLSPDTVALLEQRGHRIRRTGSIGDVAAILYDGKWLQGAADPRTEGTAKGF
jgi:gamma-glutamyltranspeptidase/glutathione hydrolase